MYQRSIYRHDPLNGFYEQETEISLSEQYPAK